MLLNDPGFRKDILMSCSVQKLKLFVPKISNVLKYLALKLLTAKWLEQASQ